MPDNIIVSQSEFRERLSEAIEYVVLNDPQSANAILSKLLDTVLTAPPASEDASWNHMTVRLEKGNPDLDARFIEAVRAFWRVMGEPLATVPNGG